MKDYADKVTISAERYYDMLDRISQLELKVGLLDTMQNQSAKQIERLQGDIKSLKQVAVEQLKALTSIKQIAMQQASPSEPMSKALSAAMRAITFTKWRQ